MSEIEHSNSLCSVEVTRVVSVSSSEWFSVVFDTLLAAFLYVAVGGAPGPTNHVKTRIIFFIMDAPGCHCDVNGNPL